MPPKPPNVPSTCFTRHSLRYLGSRSLEPGAGELHVLLAEFGCSWPQCVHDLPSAPPSTSVAARHLGPAETRREGSAASWWCPCLRARAESGRIPQPRDCCG